MKTLLMSVIGGLIVDAGVQALVIVVVKIVGHAALRVSQISKNGPLADFEDLRFEARPEAFKTLSRFSAWVVPGRALS